MHEIFNEYDYPIVSDAKGSLTIMAKGLEMDSFDDLYIHKISRVTQDFYAIFKSENGREYRFLVVPMGPYKTLINVRTTEENMVTTTGDVGEGGGGIKTPQVTGPKKGKPSRTPKPKKVK